MQYQHRNRAVFSLGHLDTLSSDPTLILQVSEQTFYLLLNLVVADIQDAGRYATAFYPERYEPLTDSDTDYDLYLAVARAAERELVEVGIVANVYGVQGTELFYDSYTFSGSGGTTIDVFTVPAGEIWEMEWYGQINYDSPYNFGALRIVKSSDLFELALFTGDDSNTWEKWEGRITLGGGDVVRARFVGCADGDEVAALCWCRQLVG